MLAAAAAAVGAVAAAVVGTVAADAAATVAVRTVAVPSIVGRTMRATRVFWRESTHAREIFTPPAMPVATAQWDGVEVQRTAP